VQLIAVNQPDKIIFVGEALVGNEAVDQLTKFNRSLRDFSGSAGAGGGGAAGGGPGKGRGVDGMILTKFDTIDDKVRRAAQSPSSRTLSSSPSTILGALPVAVQADALLLLCRSAPRSR